MTKNRVTKNAFIRNLHWWGLILVVTLVFSLFFFKKFTSPSHNPHFRRFVDHAMLREGGLYTLLGSKPVTWIDMSYSPPNGEEKLLFWESLSNNQKIHYSVDDLDFPKYNAKKIAANWVKIQQKYLGRNFNIVPYENSVFFINQPVLLNFIEENRDLFAEILGKPMQPIEVLNCIGDQSSSLWQAFLKNHFAMGLLLGYGIHNAKCFAFLVCGEDVPPSHLVDEGPSTILYEEHPKIGQLQLPMFRVFEGGEDVIDKYERERIQIKRYFQGKNFYQTVYEKMQETLNLTVEKG